MKSKKYDRLEALKTEIEKLGGKNNVTESSFHLAKIEK